MRGENVRARERRRREIKTPAVRPGLVSNKRYLYSNRL
jgi:hypothetical protein